MATTVLVFKGADLRAKEFDYTTKAAFKKYFTKYWKEVFLYDGELTNKQADPHGTIKPVAFDKLIDKGLKFGWLPPHATKWKNSYGRGY